MSLQSENSFSKNLSLIKEALNQYNGMTHVEFFNYMLNQRLKSTLYLYNKDTDHISDFLLNQGGLRVLKAVTKIQKLEDRKIIYENMEGDADDE